MIIFRQKTYSIQSGKPDKGGSIWRELGRSAAVGAIGGAAIGAAAGIPSGIFVGENEGAKNGALVGLGITAAGAAILAGLCSLSVLGAEGRAKKAARMNMNQVLDILYDIAYAPNRSVRIIKDIRRYVVENGDPSKYTVTFAINNGKGLIYLNNPEKPIIEWFNEELENLIANNRYADYAATKVKNGYMIELVLPHVNTLSGLIYNFIYEFGDDYKVSCITDGVMDKVSGKVSERTLK